MFLLVHDTRKAFFQDIKNLALESVRLVKCGSSQCQRGQLLMWCEAVVRSLRSKESQESPWAREGLPWKEFSFASHPTDPVLIRCSFYGHTNVSRKLVDERMKGTNMRLEYSPERLAWHRWHLHQHMAVTSAHLDGSFTGTELDFALDVCNGVVDVLGSWAWEMQLRMVDE